MKNLKNAKILSKEEQKNVSGSGIFFNKCFYIVCTWRCVNGKCVSGLA